MERVEKAYKDEKGWVKKSILNCARSGYFSADRSIKDYAENIWKVEKVVVPEEWEMSSSVMKSFHDK